MVPQQCLLAGLCLYPKKGKKISIIFESMILRDISQNCFVPVHQFGFQKVLSHEHALFTLFKVLADMEVSRDFIFIYELDIARAFDSCIFSQVLAEAQKERGWILS
jgi:hypothetical protein